MTDVWSQDSRHVRTIRLQVLMHVHTVCLYATLY